MHTVTVAYSLYAVADHYLYLVHLDHPSAPHEVVYRSEVYR